MKQNEIMKLSVIPSEEYPRHDFEIKAWLAKEKEFYNQVKSRVLILRATEKAYQIELEKSKEQHWIPKSQCRIIERKEVSLGFWE